MLWIKAFHIMAVVTWFAALFYLPRLFVYHAMCDDKVGHERFIIMERKLYRGIMTPSAIIVWLLGLALMSYYPPEALLEMGWLQVKLVLVAILSLYHLYCGHIQRCFAHDSNQRGHVFYRWFNELPVLILVTVVILAVLKPF